MVDRFNHIDHELAKRVAEGIGVAAPTEAAIENHGQSSAALSQTDTPKTAKGRKVAILAADGVEGSQIMAIKQALKEVDAKAEIVAKFMGTIKGADGKEIEVDKTFLTGASVMFDAVYVPGGAKSIEALKTNGEALNFINEAFKHCKAIAATGEGVDLLKTSEVQKVMGSSTADQAVITDQSSDAKKAARLFVEAIAQHRNWARQKDLVPA